MPVTVSLIHENPITVDQACKMLNLEHSTIRRMFQRGLEHFRTSPGRGGKVMTSVPAIERYLAKMNDPETPMSWGTPKNLPNLSRKAELERVERELDKAGI